MPDPCKHARREHRSRCPDCGASLPDPAEDRLLRAMAAMMVEADRNNQRGEVDSTGFMVCAHCRDYASAGTHKDWCRVAKPGEYAARLIAAARKELEK